MAYAIYSIYRNKEGFEAAAEWKTTTTTQHTLNNFNAIAFIIYIQCALFRSHGWKMKRS